MIDDMGRAFVLDDMGQVVFLPDMTTAGSGDMSSNTPIGAALEVGIGPFTLAPGDEVTYCITKKLTNPSAMDVVRIESTLSPGSHHLILYVTSDPESPNPTPCTPFAGILTGTKPLYIAESASSFLDFPAGVAYSLGAQQTYRIEAHYINASTSSLSAKGTVKLFPPATPGLVTDRADLLFYGINAINIAAGATKTVGPAFHAPQVGSKLFGVTTHTHQFGTRAAIDLATSKTQVVQPLYENLSWDNPPLKLLSPPLTLTAGQGLRFQCEYKNTSSSPVGFGESANDEMCFIWAYYYPSYGFDSWTCGAPNPC